jgi:septal ring factor EnvC (AmiA/AmiB activator)
MFSSSKVVESLTFESKSRLTRIPERCFAGSNFGAVDVESARAGAHAILPCSIAFIAASAFDPSVRMAFGHHSALMQVVASQLEQAEEGKRELSAATEAIRREVGVLQRKNESLRDQLEQAEEGKRELSAANEGIRREVGVLQRKNESLREELERLRIAHRRVVRGLEGVLDECPEPG